jgi:hypothetical protein
VNVAAPTAASMFVITSLLIVYVVAQIWGLIRHFKFANLLEVLILLGVMWVGWSVRTWPTRHKGDGMLMSLLMAWRDSVLTLGYWFLNLIGLVDIWHAVMKGTLG